MNNGMVFVTGITGFVGQNLEPYLAAYFDIQGITRNGKGGSFTYEMFLEENRPYDAFIHLAGKAHDLKGTSNDSEYYDVNYELTRQLFDQFLQSDAQKFIHISSVKATADTVEGVLTEDGVPNPVTAYGKSKLLAENYILTNIPSDKQVYILRPCMIHGPGNKGNLNLLYSVVKKGFPWPLASFENQRSFLSIENLCFVIHELLNRNDIASGIYNVADDKPLSTNELIAFISKSQNKATRTLAIPKKMITLLAKIGDILHLPLNSERLQKLTESYVASNDKIVKAIGKPLPFSAEEGFKKTFQSFNNVQ
jgi:nucleoside-diphosphate-sugar epimerase